MTTKSTYRPDIDGLRAIAVISVVLCHSHLCLAGGFVGVDVFFVISGYLITGLIVKDLELGRFSMPEFWERRARRILPALFFMTLGTMTFSWIFLLPDDFAEYARSLMAMAGLVANFYFWRDTGYFARAAEEKPLLHTWSLAVEEQFYIFVPVLLWAFWWLGRWGGRRRLVLSLLVIGFVSSFALGVWMTSWRPGAAYYLLPPRAWELFAGSLLAVAGRPRAVPRPLRESAGLAGLGLIVWACVAFSPKTPFPGVSALAPVTGSMLLIWVGGCGGSLVSRLISLRAFVGIGLISYSLYLWHWPLMAGVRYLSVGKPNDETMVLLVVLSILLGWLSWRFVESPFRKRRLCGARRPMYVFSLAGLGLFFATGFGIHAAGGFSSRLPDTALRLHSKGQQDPAYKVDYDITRMPQSFYRLGLETEQPKWMVWGDSFAMSFMPAANQALRQHGLAGYGIAHVSIAPVREFTYPTREKTEDARRKNHAILGYILGSGIENIILVGCWHGYLLQGKESFPAAISDTIRELKAHGKNVHVVMEPPSYPYNVKKALVRAAMEMKNPNTYFMPADEHARRQADAILLAAMLSDSGVSVYSTEEFFTDGQDSTKYLPCDEQGAFYYDDMHLAPHGSLRLLPLVEDILARRKPGT